jgi:hypothetical protein
MSDINITAAIKTDSTIAVTSVAESNIVPIIKDQGPQGSKGDKGDKGDSGGIFDGLTRITVSATEPVGAVSGDLWIDVS